MSETALASKSASTLTTIRPSRGWVALNLGDLWKYRELIYFLIWRDIKVRYKQAVLGVAWAIIQPVMTMVVFSIIFGKLLGVASEGNIPYPVFSYVALLPWQLFAGALQKSGVSLVGNANLITKIYFPRLVIPLASVISGLVDFALAFLVLLGLMFYYKVPLTWNILWLPLLILLAMVTAMAVGLWLSALNVQYRDVQQMIPFLVNIWFYASPAVYSANIIPGGLWQMVYALNPMAGVIQGFRWALLGTQPPDITLAISTLVVLILFVSGLFFFRRMERTFADIV